MNLRLLAFVLLATRLTAVDVWFTSAPSSVPHGQSYYVEAAAYDGSGTDVWVHKAGGWFAYNWAAGDRAGGWSADSGPQTIDYLGEALGWSDSTWGYVYTCVTIDGAAPPPNQPPSAWVEVDGHGHTATLTRPYGGAVHVTVRYKAADADGNLARIRPQVWHPGSGYFSNDGGGWTGQSGGSGEVVRTVTLDQDGDWYFWTDAEDAPGVFVNSGAWGDGFRLHVVQGTPPNQAPVTHSISGTNPALGSATTLTGHATDADGNLAWMHFYVGGPGLAAGWNYLGSAAIAGGSATAALHWTPPQQGTYAIHLRAEDTNGVYDSNANVTGSFSVGAPPDTTPPGTPHNLQVSGLTASSFTLAWSAPSDNVGVTGYRVRLNEGSFTEVGNVLSHTFSGLAANTSYGAQVSARDAAGNWSGWAGAGATTGSSGGGGPQASDSVWRHIIGGDGILDEIVRAGTGEFNFYVNEWYTTNYSYSYFPVNNQWHWWRIFWEQSVYEENFTSSWEYSHQFWVSYETFFELAFEISINYNHPFRIYRDRSASEQINLGDWELLINTVGSPGGFTMISYPIYDPADLPGAQYFMVKQGLPVGGLNFSLPGGAAMLMGATGIFGGVILPGGTTITSSGGSASVTGYGAVNPGGSLTLPGGVVVAVDGSGKVSVSFSGGVAVTVSNTGAVGLSVPAGITGITAQVFDILGQVLNAANNGVVFSVKNTIGEIFNLPNGGLLDQLPDIGLNALTGELLVGVRLAAQADSQTTWMPVNIAPISLEFVKVDDTATNTLKVAKWENAFNVTDPENPQLKPNFIDLDPDRFFLRMFDKARKGQGTVEVSLSTKSDSGEDLDDATTIQLTETGTNTGIFQSQTMILVSDDVDDAASGTDDATNDRTHKVELGGKVKVDFTFISGLAASREASVPIAKTVDVNVVILRQIVGGSPVISEAEVQNAWKIANERYAQIGVKIHLASVQIKDPPSGVDLADGLTVLTNATAPIVVADEAKALIAAYGTMTTRDDLHIFYVNTPKTGSVDRSGYALPEFALQPGDAQCIDNFFLNNSATMPKAGFAAAHELTHLLKNAAHVSEKWRLMYDFGNPHAMTAVTAPKRLTVNEETAIQENSHHAH